ncbi:MAG: leucine-rich repeat protein [Oscillospiraceae bacterium]|nr:leucine-rich repeat protein [Oscillospiraceae bacterium]
MIAPQVFADLPELEEVVLADGVTQIDNAVFARCKNLRSVQIPDSVKRIGAAAFLDCEALTDIRLPAQLVALEDEVFGGCSSLVALPVPEGVSKVGAGAFAGCTALRSMVLPDSVQTIGTGAFWDCASLQQLYISPATESIQPSALGNCPVLTTLYMPRIIHDALESKRVFGEKTVVPDIQWITTEDPKPDFALMQPHEAVAALGDPGEITVPEVPVRPAAEESFFSMKEKRADDAESVRKLEQTIAAMQEKIDALSVQNPQAAQQPALNADAIAALNANLTVIQAKFDSISGMQDSVAAISAMQEQVASIAAMQETVHERVGAISEIQEKMSEIDDIRARVDAIQPDAIGDMQQKVAEISDMRDKIDAISDIQEKVSVITDIQQKVDAITDVQGMASEISDIRQKVDAISDVQEKVSELSDIRQKVDAITEVQEKVDAISDIQQKVSAISDMQEKVDAISDIQQKVGAITDVQEKVGAISDVQEKVSEISTSQADISQRFAEMTGHRVGGKESVVMDEEMLDSAFVAVRRGNYRKDDRVFTYEISKPVEGPKHRSLMLKDFTVIAFRSFREKEGGERFEIPEGVRRVETQAFWNCPRLLALELPHSLTEVEPDAFSGCSRLTDVYLCEEFPERRAAEYFMFRPEIKLHWPKKGFLSKAKVLTVGELLEQYEDILTAEKVKKLQVGNHVLQIPDGYSILAPDMAKGIDPRANDPEHCLETIVLPKSLRRIGARAFAGLETLRHIVMSKGLQIIDMNAFTGCTGPYRLVLPNGVPYIGPYAFAAPCRFEQIRLPKRLQRICENTFSNCDSLCSLRIPSAVQEIGDCALSGCTALTGLTLSKRFENDLKRILDGPVKLNVMWTEDVQDTFRNPPPEVLCDVLTPSMEPLPSHRLFTKEAAESCNTFQEKLALLRSRPYVAAHALSDMANQTKFEIPLGVMRLCSYAFGHNDRLLTLTIPKAIRTFEYAAFYGLSHVRDVFLPDDFDRDSAAVLFMNHPQVLLNIGGSRSVRVRQVLHDCPWVLTANDISDLSVRNGVMTVPSGYMVIASYAYHGIMGMTHLRCLQIPPTARIIGYHAFTEQDHLEEVICAEGLLAVEPHAFVNCHSLRRVVLPSTLRFLGSNPFMGCMRLETIVLPRSFADREEELRRDCPHLKIQWCEDFDADARPSVVVDYSDLMSEAMPASAEMLTPFEEEDIPVYHREEDAFDSPIEAALLSEETIPQMPESQTIASAVSGTIMLEDHAAAEEAEETAAFPAAIAMIGGEEAEFPADIEAEPETAPAEETSAEEISDALPEEDTSTTQPEGFDPFDDAMSALADALFSGAGEESAEEESTDDAAEESSEEAEMESSGEAAPDDAVAEDEAAEEIVPDAVDDAAGAPTEELQHSDDAEASDEEAAALPVGEETSAEIMNDIVENLFAEEIPAVEAPEEIPAETESEMIAAPAWDGEEADALADALFAAVETVEAADDSEAACEESETAEEDAEALWGGDEADALADILFAQPVVTETAPENEEITEESPAELPSEEVDTSSEETTVSVPEDGRLTAKECRRIYHGESCWEIPAGYREIRAGACAALEDLTAVVICDTMQRIGNGAFADCSALENITLPLSLQTLESDAFEGCDNITAVTAPEAMQEQVMAVFGDSVAYTWLKEPPKIIGDGRFTAKIRNGMYCDEEELVIPEGYLEIRAGACAGLEELKRVILPSTLVKIAAGAFADCSALEEIAIPESVTELAEDAFEGCTALRRVTAPAHLESVIRTNFTNVLVQLTENE